MFEWQEQYLTSERSERVRYLFLPREHKIHILVRQRGRVVRASDLKSVGRGFKSRSDH